MELKAFHCIYVKFQTLRLFPFPGSCELSICNKDESESQQKEIESFGINLGVLQMNPVVDIYLEL